MPQQLSAEVNINVVKAKNSLNDLSRSSKVAGDNLQRNLGKAAISAETSISKIGASTGRATQTITNFNRVIQDSPFGIIGIANNIDPLIQSFQALKTSTGSTGGALKALGASLIGPGGVLFAFSALSTGAILLTQKYGSLEAGISALLGNFDALADANKKIEKSFAEAQGEAAGEVAVLRSLVTVAQDETNSRKQRQEAINRLNKEYDEYLPNLTLETIGSEKAKKAIDELSKSLVRQAQIKGLQDLISKETQKQFEAIGKTAIDNATGWQKFKAALQGLATKDFGGAVGALGVMGDKTRTEAIDNTTTAIKRYTDELLKLIDVDTEVQATTLTGGKKPKFDFKQYLDNLIKTLEFQVNADPKIRLTPQIEVLPSGIEIKTGEVAKLNQVVAQSINTSLAVRPFVVKPIIRAEPILDDKELSRLVSRIESILATGLADAVAGIGESVGKSIAEGTNVLQALTSSFMTAFAGLIESIGKALIQYGIVKTGLDKIIKGGIAIPGAVAIAAGLAAVAVANLVKTAVPTKFAEGGIITGPTLGLVGEGGQPEVILPLSKINQFLDDRGSSGGELTTRVSGDDLLFIMNRATRRQNRNF